MSLRDEQRAADYIASKPQVRPRTTGLALWLLLLVVWLMAMLARCTAAYRTLVVTADFAQAANLAHWSLALNIPLEFTVTFNDQAPDREPSPLLGVYESPECCTTLRFGPYYISVPHTEVRVWHGWDGVAEGISFGNKHPFTAYGLNVDAYRLYAFFPNFFFQTPGFDDSLSQVALRASDPHFRYNSYVFLYGWTWWETYLQTGQPVAYSLPIVTPNPK